MINNQNNKIRIKTKIKIKTNKIKIRVTHFDAWEQEVYVVWGVGDGWWWLWWLEVASSWPEQ